MTELVDPKIAAAIVRVREGNVKIVPGYDGVYGEIIIFSEEEKAAKEEGSFKKKSSLKTRGKAEQRSLADFV
jgi:PHP family Zn ribbon phosphoesterase